MMIVASVRALTPQTKTPEAPFQTAETLSVTDFSVANNCSGNGTVVLDAVIAETGDVQKVEVRRDIACLTQLAVRAVERWRFSPASFAGKAIASRVRVAITFPPPGAYVNPIPLPELKPQCEAAIQAAFQPAEVTRAVFPNYYAPTQTTIPVASHADRAIIPRHPEQWDTAVLEVTLSEKGEGEEIKVFGDCFPLTKGVKDALGDWRFMPAAF